MNTSFPVEGWRKTWLRIVSPSGDAWAVHPAEAGTCEGIFPFESPVHVITAWNPRSRLLESSENLQRHRQLLQQLKAAGEEIHEGTGSAADGSWAEEGIARIGQSLESSIEIGKEWQQDAIWEWHPQGLAAVECESGQRHEWGWVLAALPSRPPFTDLEGLICPQDREPDSPRP